MNKKIKVIMLSVAVIAMCVSLIAGATFALFTSESGVNIAVTSGKVDVVATLANAQTTQRGAEYVAGTANVLGTANIVDGNVQLDNIAPGDGIKFDIEIANNSTIGIQYRVVVNAADNNTLAKALEVSVGDSVDSVKHLASYTSAWAAKDAKAAIESIPVEIYLPENTGNEYQGLNGYSVSIRVEAVQGNADVEGEEHIATGASASSAAVLATVLSDISENGGTAVLTSDLSLTVPFVFTEADVTIDLNGHTYNATGPALYAGNKSGTNKNTLTVENGVINSTVTKNTQYALTAQYGASMVVKNVVVNEDGLGGGIVIWDNSCVTVEDCEFHSSAWAVSTNGSSTNNAKIEIRNTILDAAGSAVMLNAPGGYILDNCTITASKIGLFLRAGDFTVTNCTIKTAHPAKPGDNPQQPWCSNGANETTPNSCIVLGTDPVNTGYKATAKLAISGCTFAYTDEGCTDVDYIYVMAPNADRQNACTAVPGRTTILNVLDNCLTAENLFIYADSASEAVITFPAAPAGN